MKKSIQVRRSYGSLSALQRRLTPKRFCIYLYERVLTRFHVSPVAVLWVDNASDYYFMGLGVECWGKYRDARTYNGPWPCICHPPCGSWGYLKHFSRQPLVDGIMAMEYVHKYGGVVEQPLGSSLFREHGRPGGRIEVVDQADYGHLIRKRTLLYWPS